MKQLGKMTVDEFVAFLHTLAPQNSHAEDKMKNNAFFNSNVNTEEPVEEEKVD